MRYLKPWIVRDLAKKMVFVGGARQCGKTTLAKSILAESSGRYFNWDNEAHRRALRAQAWSADDALVVFDELHKLPKWKTWIKGVYDTKEGAQTYLVTGSAR